MGKKRKRALIDTSQVEFDPDFFDDAVDVNTDHTPADEASSSLPLPDHRHSMKAADDGTPDGIPSIETVLQEELVSLENDGEQQPPELLSTPSVVGEHAYAKSQATNPPFENSNDSQGTEVVVLGSTDTEADCVDLCDSENYVIDLCSSDSAGENVPQMQPEASVSPAAREATPADDDAEALKQARKEDSLQPVVLSVESLVPGHERTFEVSWQWAKPLFGLQDQFGPHAVLVFEGGKKPWFSSPKRITKGLAKDQSSLSIQIMTEQQFENMLRLAELGEYAVVQSGADDADQSTKAVETGFVVTIAGRDANVRAMVTPETSVQQLVDHFLTETSKSVTGKLRVVFDGDALKLADKIGDFDIEEDDKIDVFLE